jgi:hypothetical protein
MRLTSRTRKFVIFALVLLVLPAWAMGSLSLVWCVGPNGHSAIEWLALGDFHHATPTADRAGKHSAEDGTCTDFSLWQRAEVSRKLKSAAPQSPNLAAAGILPEAELGSAECDDLKVSNFQSDFVAFQLTQLRTVILLI